MSKSVLVTGCLGYVGSVLCQELIKQDYDVVGWDNCRYHNGNVLLGLVGHENFQFENADVRFLNDKQVDVIKHVDVVIPLAGLVGAPVCDANPKEASSVNYVSIYEFAELLSGHQHVIFPNTNSGYGQTDGSSFCTEEDELNPISLYANDKCEAEWHVLNSRATSTVFRLATVFGASPRMRMDLMVNDFTRRLTYIKQDYNGGWSKTPFEVFDPHYKRNFVHVMDVVRAFIHAIEYRLTGVFNLGLPDANLTKLELAHFICDQIQLDRDFVTIGEGSDPDQRNYIVSNDKILATGFEFKHGLAKGVEEVVTICNNMSQTATCVMGNV